MNSYTPIDPGERNLPLQAGEVAELTRSRRQGAWPILLIAAAIVVGLALAGSV